MDKNFQQKTSVNILALIKELESRLIEREQLIRLVVLAIFSKQHMFLIGPPGVSKSLTMRLLNNTIDSSKYWELQMAKSTKIEQLFGTKITNESGEIIYSGKNTMLTSHIIGLDELFKADYEVLNDILQLLVDRYYTSGDGVSHHTDIISVFGASNEYPTSKEMLPFLDRFMFWCYVKPIQDYNKRVDFFKGNFIKTPLTKKLFTLDDISYINKEVVESVSIDDEISMHYTKLTDKIIRRDVRVSDRKLIHILEIVIKTSAYLNNRTKVDYSDLFLLLHTAWHSEIERVRVEEVIYQYFFKTIEEFNLDISTVNSSFEKADLYYKQNCFDIVNYMFDIDEKENRLKFDVKLKKMDELLEYLKNILNGTDSISIKTISIHINNVQYIEDLLEKNIFLLGIKNRTINKDNRKDFSDLTYKIKHLYNTIDNWVNKNNNHFEYITNKQTRKNNEA
jgi:MoxR-like ATPase